MSEQPIVEMEPMSPEGEQSAASVDPAFDRLFEEEWAPLVALGWSLLGSWTEAEDIVQDAFADAYRRWERVGGLERPGAWLRRAVINRTVSVRRHAEVARRGHRRLGGLQVVDGDGPSADRTGDAVVERVSDDGFWEAVRTLPERQAACVALRYVHGLPIKEIAAVLECRPGTVKAHLHRGRAALAELFDVESTEEAGS